MFNQLVGLVRLLEFRMNNDEPSVGVRNMAFESSCVVDLAGKFGWFDRDVGLPEQ